MCRWRSLETEPPTSEEQCWIAVPNWLDGGKSYLVVLVYLICSGGHRRFFQGPGDASQGIELFPSHWLPLDEWPLPSPPGEE